MRFQSLLDEHHYRNLASPVLSLCEHRICRNWGEHIGYPLLLLETVVDSRYPQGTIYRAANCFALAETRGFRRAREGYSPTAQQPKSLCASFNLKSSAVNRKKFS